MPGKKWIGVCLIALCGASQSAFADWKGKGELGASFASGEYARQMDTYPGLRR